MTRSGDQCHQIAPRTYAIHFQPPPHMIQPDFKAHRRKTSGVSGEEISKISSPSASTSSQSIASPQHKPPQHKISSSPQRDIFARLDKRHPKHTPSTSTSAHKSPSKDPRPRSLEIDHRLYRDLFNPQSTSASTHTHPTKATVPAPARTQMQIRQDSTGLLARKGAPVSPPSPGQHRSTQLPLYAPSNDQRVPSNRQPPADTSTSISTRQSHPQQETKLSPAADMVGAKEEYVDDKSAGSRILIKGGQVVNDDGVCVADVFLEDGIIKQVGPNLAVPGGARVIDVKGKYVFPGGIDANTHFQLPYMGTTTIDDYYSGTKAAVAGGTTTIIGTVLPQRGESLVSAFEKWRGLADPKACCDYGLSVSITHWSDKVGDEMGQLASHGVNSFKFCMGNKGSHMLRDDELYQGLQQCRRIGAVARVHAENGDLVAMREKEILSAGVTGPEGFLQAHSEEAESEATTRACIIARQANCPLYILNLTSKGAADAVGDAKRHGSVVHGETAASALFTDGHHYFDKNWRHAAAHVTSPPLRLDSTTPRYLMQLLSGGDLQIAASAHRTYTSNQKSVGKDDFTKIPDGVNGVEERMMVVWEKGVNTGKMDLMRFVAVTSTNAAKIFNIYPKKGRIAEGSDADVVIWDPDCSKTVSVGSHHSQSDFNIFEGLTCHGVPFMTIAGGKVVYEDGQLHVTEGVGKYVPLPPNSPHVFSSIAVRERAMRPFKVDRDGVSPKTSMDNGSHNKSSVDNGPKVTTSPSPSPVSAPSPPIPRRSEPFLEPLMPATSRKDKEEDFHNRPLTKAGSRNMQDSTFALSGAQADDDQGNKRSTRVSKPPGGESRGLW